VRSRPNWIARQERLAGTPPRPPLLRHTAAITVATTPVRRLAGECYGIDPVPDSPAPATGGHGSGSGRHHLRRTGAGSHSHASPGAGPPLEAAPLSRGREAEPGSRAATVPVFVNATAINCKFARRRRARSSGLPHLLAAASAAWGFRTAGGGHPALGSCAEGPQWVDFRWSGFEWRYMEADVTIAPALDH